MSFRRQGYEVAAFSNRRESHAGDAPAPADLALIDIGLQDEIEGGFELCRQLRARVSRAPDHFPHRARQRPRHGIRAAHGRGRLPHEGHLATAPAGAHRCTVSSHRGHGHAPAAEDVLERGKLTLNLKRMDARWSGRPIELTLTEFWIVHALAKFPGHVKDRDALMREASLTVDDSTITSHIKRIRRKFIALDDAFDSIESVYGMGYRWHGDR
jgi:two-component system OmpR family response regulator